MLNVCCRVFNSMDQCLSWWIMRKGKKKSVPFYIIWELWEAQNHWIFNGTLVNIVCIYSKILAWVNAHVGEVQMDQGTKAPVPHPIILFRAGMFDGVVQVGKCGFGAWIRFSLHSYYKLLWQGDYGTNPRAEVLALWGLLWLTRIKQIHHIHIYGDSKSFINDIQGLSNFAVSHLKLWMNRIVLLKQEFQTITF